MPAYARPPGAAGARPPGGAGHALRRFGAVPALAGLALFLLLPVAALLVEAAAGGAGLWGRMVADPLFGPAVRRTVALGAATATL
ncbi:MAG: hypothetical protein RLZ83_504, partial [Pseudomonadota bacterium]